MIRNEVLDAIHARRSTRSFTDQQIGAEQLDALLDAAIWAPSGGTTRAGCLLPSKANRPF